MATVLGSNGQPASSPAQTVDALPASPSDPQAVPVAVVPAVRSPVGTSSGASLSVVLVWIWQILAPKYQLPEMPTEVAMVIAITVTDLARQLLSRGHPA